MSNGTLIFSNKNIVTADALVNIGGHTSSVYVHNKGGADIDIKLNALFTVLIPAETTGYMEIPGDYTSVEVITAASAISFYAVG